MAQSIKALMSLQPQAIEKMTEVELRKTVSILSSAANKRLKRLELTQGGAESPAYHSAMKRAYTGERGGKFGTAGKNLNQLRNEYKAVSGFLGMKTSSVGGWKRYKKKVYSAIGGEFNDAEREKLFWSMYRKIEELHPELIGKKSGSSEIQRDLRSIQNEKSRKNIMIEINLQNTPTNKKHRERYSEELANQGVVIDQNGKRVHIDPSDNEDLIYLMSLRVGAKYEQQQRDFSAEDEEFIEV